MNYWTATVWTSVHRRNRSLTPRMQSQCWRCSDQLMTSPGSSETSPSGWIKIVQRNITAASQTCEALAVCPLKEMWPRLLH